MGKVLQSKRLKKGRQLKKSDEDFFLTLDELYSEIPSISLVKGCSDQREILCDATDKNFN